jgi:hypothetical protein
MARFELTGHDRYRIEAAREELARLQRRDVSDPLAMAHLLGRVEVALRQLLDVFDEGGES